MLTKCPQFNLPRVCLIFTNVIFLLAGLLLVTAAIILLLDTDRVLLSRVVVIELQHPLFYYAALACILIGLTVSSLSVLGCWATHCNNNCLLGTFIFLLIVLLVVESVISMLAMVCPQYLGIMLEREELLDTWQRYYGVPGREQFTAAVDLIQTKMKCCGVTGSGDYGTTWWRIRQFAAPDLLVPLSCCVLKEPPQYLDPDPVNVTVCQNNIPEIYQISRYTEGCLMQLETWLSEQILIVISTAIMLVVLQLMLLFFSILMCVKAGGDAKSNSTVSERSNKNQHNYYNKHNNSLSIKEGLPYFIN
ncbi:tetraspanin 68C [Lycorma delicatula]|uniref:tetraspanin 68C n=1 Tax=Lycorma delicatula TaxID=130591 RepID=UPI003F511119